MKLLDLPFFVDMYWLLRGVSVGQNKFSYFNFTGSEIASRCGKNAFFFRTDGGMAAASRERLAVAIPLFFDCDFRRPVQDCIAVR